MNTTRTVILTPVSTRRASEAICEQIRSMILSGELKPGDRLPSERAMMDMLGRSRPTIREALRMLENDELVRIVPGSGGAIVMQPSSQSVEQPLETMLSLEGVSHAELLEFRRINEVAAAGWAAARRTEQELEQLSGLVALAERNSGDFRSFAGYDIAFHQAIAAAGHNRIAAIVDKVVHQLVLNMLLASHAKKQKREQKQMMESISRSHRAVYDAIAAGDPAAAEAAMSVHIDLFADDLKL